MTTKTTTNGAGESSPAPDGSARRTLTVGQALAQIRDADPSDPIWRRSLCIVLMALCEENNVDPHRVM